MSWTCLKCGAAIGPNRTYCTPCGDALAAVVGAGAWIRDPDSTSTSNDSSSEGTVTS